MKTQKECEELGTKMKLDDFLVLPDPNNYINLKAAYLKEKYVYMLTGYFRKQNVKMEDKIKALKHVLKITGFRCGDGTDEALLGYINKEIRGD